MTASVISCTCFGLALFGQALLSDLSEHLEKGSAKKLGNSVAATVPAEQLVVVPPPRDAEPQAVTIGQPEEQLVIVPWPRDPGERHTPVWFTGTIEDEEVNVDGGDAPLFKDTFSPLFNSSEGDSCLR